MLENYPIKEKFDFALELLLREMGCNLIQSANGGVTNFDDMLKNLDIYHKFVEHSLRATDDPELIKRYKLHRFENLIKECDQLIIDIREYKGIDSPLE